MKDASCQALVSAWTSTQQRTKSTHGNRYPQHILHTLHTHTMYTHYTHTLSIHTQNTHCTCTLHIYHIHTIRTHSTHTIFTLSIHTLIHAICTHCTHTLYAYIYIVYIHTIHTCTLHTHCFLKIQQSFLWTGCYNVFTVESSQVLVGGKRASLSQGG